MSILKCAWWKSVFDLLLVVLRKSYCSICTLTRFSVKSEEAIYSVQVCQNCQIQSKYIVDKPKLEPEDDGPDRVQLCLAVDQADEAVEVVDGATWTSTHPLGVNRYGTLLWHTMTTNQLEGLKVLHLQPQGPAENSLDGLYGLAQLSLSLFAFAFNHR